MRKILVNVFVLSISFSIYGQSIDKIITAKEATRIETILSADDMQGRRTFTPGIDKASVHFISERYIKQLLSSLNIL